MTVDLSLNARGRAAICVIEDVCGCTLPEALELAIDDLVTQIGEDATGFLQAAGNDQPEPLQPADQECDWLRLTTDTIDFHRTGADLTVTLDGRAEGLYTAEMTGSVLSALYGHPTGEVDIASRFRLTLTWNLSVPGMPGTHTSVLTDGRGVTMIW